MIRRAGAVVLSALATSSAVAEPPKPLPPSPIRWADTFSDAVIEATERNVAIFLHSHCNT